MANIYVSQSTANGYGVGLDSRSRATAASKSTPVLSITRALSVALAGDAITVNDGTYSEAGFLVPVVANLTLSPENAYQVTIQTANGADARVLHINALGTGIVVGKFILDCQGAHANGVTGDSSTLLNDATFHGTRVLSPTTGYGFDFSKVKNFTLDQGWSVTASAAAPSGGVYLHQTGGNNTGTYTVIDGTVDVTSASSSTTVYGVRVEYVSGQPDRVVVQRNSVTIALTGSTAVAHGIWVVGATLSATVTDNTVSYTAAPAGSSPNGIEVSGGAASGPTIGRCTVLRNTATTSFAPLASGIGIAVGRDDDTTPSVGVSTIKNILIAQNKSVGFNHGVFVGWQANAVVAQNRVDNVVLGLVDKHTPGGSVWSGNILSRINTSGGGHSALRSKGSTSPLFVNNLYIASAGYLGRFLYADVASVTATYKGNLMVAVGVVPTVLVQADDTSTMAFSQNSYYTDQTLVAGAFNIRSTTYSTLAAWIAAVETDALALNPAFRNAASDDFTVLSTSGIPRAAQLNDWNLRDSLSRTLSRIAPCPGV